MCDGSGSSVCVGLPVAGLALHVRRVLLLYTVSLVLSECYGEVAVAHEVVFALEIMLCEFATLIHTRCSTAAGYLVRLSFPLVLYGCHWCGDSRGQTLVTLIQIVVKQSNLTSADCAGDMLSVGINHTLAEPFQLCAYM